MDLSVLDQNILIRSDHYEIPDGTGICSYIVYTSTINLAAIAGL